MSYQTADMKWGEPVLGTDSGVIYWTADLTGLVFDTSLYSEDDFMQAMQDAFQAWEDVSDVDFELAPDGVDADITVGTGLLEGSTVGLANYWYYPLEGTDQIISASITMDTEPTWTPYGEPGGLDFYAVALHEIGHSIGLHHVSDTTEIMNFYVAADDLGDGDIAGVQELYGADTVGSVEEPPVEEPPAEEPPAEEPPAEEPPAEEPPAEEPPAEEPPAEEEPTGGGKGPKDTKGPKDPDAGNGNGKGNGHGKNKSDTELQFEESTLKAVALKAQDDEAKDPLSLENLLPEAKPVADELPAFMIAEMQDEAFCDFV